MWSKTAQIIFFLLTLAVCVIAHPLGNFSINSFVRIEVEKDQVHLRGILDVAEIPTFQESQKIDTDKDGTLDQQELEAYLENLSPQILANYKLWIDERPVQFQIDSKKISLVAGAGNLPTLRIEWSLTAPTSALENNSIHRLRFENNNYRGRVGWNEVVVNRTSGINIFDSNAFGSAVTDELKTYPEDLLTAPLAEREAEFSYTASAAPAGARMLENRNGGLSAPVQKDKFAELIAVPEITLPIVLFGLLLAFGFGALHAMSPGHGKTVVGAYLVGSRGNFKHAVFLGLTVTVTHTIGVFAIGLVTLFAANIISPEKLMPFLGFVSGLLVFYIGIMLFKDRLSNALGRKNNSEIEHSHEFSDDVYIDTNDDRNSLDEEIRDDGYVCAINNGFTHTHGGSTHSHLPPEKVTWKNLLTLGVSGGLLPCPSALVLMLSAISLGRIGYGLILTVAFSFGLAATLTGIGLVFLYLGKAFGGSRLADNRIFKMIPVFSAFVIACLGAVICYKSFI